MWAQILRLVFPDSVLSVEYQFVVPFVKIWWIKVVYGRWNITSRRRQRRGRGWRIWQSGWKVSRVLMMDLAAWSWTSGWLQEELLIGTCTDALVDLQLPRSNKQCPHCKETEAVFFQSQQRSAETGMVSWSSIHAGCGKFLNSSAETVLRLLQLRSYLPIACITGFWARAWSWWGLVRISGAFEWGHHEDIGGEIRCLITS